MRVPHTDVVLHTISVCGNDNDSEDESMTNNAGQVRRATTLHEERELGSLSRVECIDIRVGCIFDGGVMHYEDGYKMYWGPLYRRHDGEHQFGGHVSSTLQIPTNAEIQKVEVNRRGWGRGIMGGIRVYLSTGQSAGELNAHDQCDYDAEEDDDDSDSDGEDADYDSTTSRSVSTELANQDVVTLEAADCHRIIGSFGTSLRGSGYCTESGIVTIDRGCEVPLQAYDIDELRNCSGR